MTPLPTPGREFHRLLIANRGEIALRLARAARAAHLIPLGVYSEADADAAHLDAMEDAVCIGPPAAAESYLDIDRVLAAARTLQADAIHPGYGFLSERAAFARAVREAGLVFVGPSAEALAAMGDKGEAKRRARAAGVPVLPGYEAGERDLARLQTEARRIGTPLLVKATAGGGGRGMRIVTDLAGLGDALAAARREAAAAFGDDAVLLEKFLERPRHIEFQILADEYGTTVHLGERECSIQRRRQKLLEEAPSVALDHELRARMGAAAVRVARSVGYTNAGTVEFLLAPDGAFYFLEMNARLQVEHPVTELVHGIDIVRWQFALAAGAPLTLKQEDVRARGWAVEVRLNAEDAASGLPATGCLTRFVPPHGPGLRVDAGVRAGSEIGIFYDSLIAKVIGYGSTRGEAIERVERGLQRFDVVGVRTNLALLEAIVREPDFRRGATTTAYLEEHPELHATRRRPPPQEATLLALGALLEEPRAWRLGGVNVPLHLRAPDAAIDVTASRTGTDRRRYRLEGALEQEVSYAFRGAHVVAQTAGGRSAGTARVDPGGVAIDFAGATYRFDLAPPPSAGGAKRKPIARGAIAAPMPGKIVTVGVRAGDVVAERDLLVVLEAMKMEHRIEATQAGTVRSVTIVPGAVVQAGTTLVELEV